MKSLVVLRFRSSYLNVPRVLTNFGIGPLARNRRAFDAFLAQESLRTAREESVMQVSEGMSGEVNIASPQQSIREAAQMMAAIDAGVLPVGENDRLVGMITDRDIAVRAVATGKGPDTQIREVMSTDVKYCFADDEIDEVARNMAEIKLRRLPVLNDKKRLVG